MRDMRNGRCDGAFRRRWMRRALLPVMLGAFSFVGACRGSANNDEAPEPQPVTTLVVKNQAFLDMTIYVYRSTQRIRLGIAEGSNTVRLVIPPNLLFGTTALRFQAAPIGGSRQPLTQEISVGPGDEIELVIPPT